MSLRRESCELLIAGAGPAGLAAAQAAAPSGARIVIVDDNAAPGGQIWRDGPAATLPREARALRDAVAALANVKLTSGTRIVARGVGPRALLLEDEQGATLLQFERLIIATGARELLLPFPGWTLPGVTGAGALQALIKGGLPVAGERIVIAGSGPLLLAAAKTAREAGAKVLLIAEQATLGNAAAFAAGLWRWPRKAWQALTIGASGWRSASHVLEARGDDSLRSVLLRSSSGTRELACERLACGFGLVPNGELGRLLGCAVDAQGAISVDELQRCSVDGLYAAGECAGIGGVDAALVQGAIAGHAAAASLAGAASASALAAARSLSPQRERWRRFAAALERRFALRDEVLRLVRDDTLVCRCEDVPHAALAACESWLDAKLHTRCGMGPCQGRICGAATRMLYGWMPAPPHHLLNPARLETLAAMT